MHRGKSQIRVLRAITLALVLCAIGTISAAPIAVPAPTVEKSTCKSSACNKLASIQTLQCATTLLPLIPRECKFDSSGGTLNWCVDDTTLKCTIFTPITPNQCDGYCERDASIPCHTTATNKCVFPNP